MCCRPQKSHQIKQKFGDEILKGNFFLLILFFFMATFGTKSVILLALAGQSLIVCTVKFKIFLEYVN